MCWWFCCPRNHLKQNKQYEEMADVVTDSVDRGRVIDLKDLTQLSHKVQNPDMLASMAKSQENLRQRQSKQEEYVQERKDKQQYDSKVEQPKQKAREKKTYSFSNRKRLNPEDFKFSGRKNETCFKPLGSVNANQFNIQNCDNSKLIVFDRISSSFIDQCTNCYIYTGPADTSVFIRNCQNCVIFTIASQLRIRDCKNCTFRVHVSSQPAIESSQNLTFNVYPKDGPVQMRNMISQSSLDPWLNYWSDVYDFSKSSQKVYRLQFQRYKDQFFKEQLQRRGVQIVQDLFLETAGSTHSSHSHYLFLLLSAQLTAKMHAIIPLLNNDFNVIRLNHLQLPLQILASLENPKPYEEAKVVVLKLGGGQNLKQQIQISLDEWKEQFQILDNDLEMLERELLVDWSSQH